MYHQNPNENYQMYSKKTDDILKCILILIEWILEILIKLKWIKSILKTLMKFLNIYKIL